MSDPESNSPLPAGPRRSIRRWFQFRLRTLLAAVTVVAVALWAFRVYVEPYRQQRRAVEVVKELGGRVVTAEARPWQRRLLGADLVNITLIDLADCHQVDEYLPHVAGLPCLETLVVGGEEFTDDHLRRLRLPKLTGLVLDSTAVTDEALSAWQETHAAVEIYQSDRQALRSGLHRGGTHVQNGGHARLEQLVGKEYFHELSKLWIPLGDPSQLARYRRMRQLKELEVYAGGATDLEVKLLHGARQVVGLTVQFGGVTDEGLAAVGSLTRLAKLNLDSTQVSSAGLGYLTTLRELRSLSVRDTRIDDDGLAHLGGLVRLEKLDLGRTNVTDAGLRHLLPLTALKVLRLDGFPITDAGLASLTPLANLEELRLDGTEVTDVGLVHCASWPKLEALSLGNTAVTDAGLAHLHGLRRLASINLYRTRVTAAGLRRLHAAFPGLRVTLENERLTEDGS